LHRFLCDLMRLNKYITPMMKKLLKLFKVLFAVLFIVIVGLIAIPFFFKEDIIEGIKAAANDEMEATLSFDDVSISLIRHFPNLMVDIQNASLTGTGEFEGIELYSAKNTIIDLDLKSVWDKKRVGTAQKVALIAPIINIYTSKAGTSNYDIMKPADPTISSESESSFAINLSDISIEDGTFYFNDESSDVVTRLEDMDIDGHATLRGSIYDIDYWGTVEQTNIKTGGIKYLRNVKTKLTGGVLLDLDQSKYEFKETDLVINDLDLDVNGFVQTQSSSILMDINFKSKDDSFKKLWSLIPAAYSSDFSNAKIAGLMGVEGYVRGTYNSAKAQLPSFDIKIKANKGAISYPGMPKEIKDIFADITINSPGSLDQLSIDIPTFKFNMDESPFSGRFLAKNTSTNPDIDMAMDGTIDLGVIQEIMPLEDIEQLDGRITTDFQVKGKMSDLNNGAYQNTLISGSASLEEFVLAQKDLPLVKLGQAQATFSPKSVKVKDVQGQLGDTRFNANMDIENVISLLTPGQAVKGKLEWRSDILDMNQWMTSESTEIANQSAAPASFESYLPDNFQLAVDARSDMIKYGDYEARNVIINGNMINGDLDIQNMSTQLDESDFQISGNLSNVIGFLLAGEDLTGDMKLKSKYLNMNQFMTEDEGIQAKATALEEDLDPITIPEAIKVNIDTDIARLTYDDIDVSNINGIVNVANGEARMRDVDAKAFDGNFKLNGGYIGKVGETPKFDLEYTIDKFNFKEAFDKVNTIKFLAPVGKFIRGNFNSTLKISGDLGDDLMPDFNSINADGFVETFNGLLAGFKPLELVGQYINEEDINKMQLTDTKNYFTVAKGIVTVNEFDQKLKDIDMKISGTHSLAQEINYLIKTKIPKEKLAKTGITDVVDKGLAQVNTQLNKLGFNIDKGKYINLNFVITGTISSPKVDVRVVGMDGESDITDVVKEEINAAVETVKDSVKTRVNAEIDTLTTKAEEKRDEIIDTASVIINQKVDSIKAEVQEEVAKVLKDEIGDVVPDSLRTAIDSIILKGGGKEMEKVKDILKDWNPLKKKKKKNPLSPGG